jgi:hypothetical protein
VALWQTYLSYYILNYLYIYIGSTCTQGLRMKTAN